MNWRKVVVFVPWLAFSAAYWLGRAAVYVLFLVGGLLVGLGVVVLVIFGPIAVASFEVSGRFDNGLVALVLGLALWSLLAALGLVAALGLLSGGSATLQWLGLEAASDLGWTPSEAWRDFTEDSPTAVGSDPDPDG